MGRVTVSGGAEGRDGPRRGGISGALKSSGTTVLYVSGQRRIQGEARW